MLNTISQALCEVEIDFPVSADKTVVERAIREIAVQIAKSGSPDKVITSLRVTSDSKDGEKIDVMVSGPGAETLVNELHEVSFAEKYGWFVRTSHIIYKFTLEPIYPTEAYDVPRYLYHSTWRKNLEAIKREGLIPFLAIGRSVWHGFHYPPRIFLTTDIDVEAAGEIVLQVNTKKVGRGVKFYQDPFWNSSYRNKTGVWTPSAIPPRAIKIISG